MSRTLGVFARNYGVMCLMVASLLGCESGDDASVEHAVDAVQSEVVFARPAPDSNSNNNTIRVANKNAASAAPWKPSAPERDWKYIVLHHTATDSGNVESINRVHKARKDSAGNPWLGIGYHFVIGNGHGMDDGAIETTFRWRTQLHGAHAGSGDYNDAGIGVCLVGNFDDGPPTQKQLTATRRLIRTLKRAYGIDRKNIVGHGDVKKTACPGRHFQIAQVTQDATKETTVDGRSQPSTGTGVVQTTAAR